MSKPTVKITQTIYFEHVLTALVEVVRKNLRLDLKNTCHLFQKRTIKLRIIVNRTEINIELASGK